MPPPPARLHWQCHRWTVDVLQADSRKPEGTQLRRNLSAAPRQVHALPLHAACRKCVFINRGASLLLKAVVFISLFSLWDVMNIHPSRFKVQIGATKGQNRANIHVIIVFLRRLRRDGPVSRIKNGIEPHTIPYLGSPAHPYPKVQDSRYRKLVVSNLRFRKQLSSSASIEKACKNEFSQKWRCSLSPESTWWPCTTLPNRLLEDYFPFKKKGETGLC